MTMADYKRDMRDLEDAVQRLWVRQETLVDEVTTVGQRVEADLLEIKGVHEDHADEAFLRGIAIALVFGVFVLTWTEYQVYAVLWPLAVVMMLLCAPGVRKALGMHYRKFVARWQNSIIAPAKRPVAASATTVTEQTVELRAPQMSVHSNGHH